MRTPARVFGAGRLVRDVIVVPRVRRSWYLRLRRPHNLFQPHNDTSLDRYPELFRFLQEQLRDGPDVRLLSFGCSVGDEVFTLRQYFPSASITGIDISAGNVRACRRRQRRSRDDRMSFRQAGSTTTEASASYDVVLCMAVLRHGDLGAQQAPSCGHRLSFFAFEPTAADLARCVKVGGYLVIEHSNFRFGDIKVSGAFEVVLRRPRGTPLYGPDNTRIDNVETLDVIFRRL
jgi:hypothetical protein